MFCYKVCSLVCFKFLLTKSMGYIRLRQYIQSLRELVCKTSLDPQHGDWSRHKVSQRTVVSDLCANALQEVLSAGKM